MAIPPPIAVGGACDQPGVATVCGAVHTLVCVVGVGSEVLTLPRSASCPRPPAATPEPGAKSMFPSLKPGMDVQPDPEAYREPATIDGGGDPGVCVHQTTLAFPSPSSTSVGEPCVVSEVA